MVTSQAPRLSEEEKHKLALEYATLVKPIARRVAVNLPSHLSFEDLLQEGVLGLMDALERFDPSQGYELRTFAAQRIKGAILDALRRDDFTGRGVRRRARQLNVARQALSTRLGRTPARAELAQEAGVSMQELARRERESNRALVESLNQPLRSCQEMSLSLIDTIADKASDTSVQAEVSLRIQALARALETLPERERQLLSLYYNEGLNIREIALIFSVSEARISQLHKRALSRLATTLDGDPMASTSENRKAG